MEAVALNPSFWQGRRVLVTGHTGFKGSWLTLLLGLLGAKVTGFALPPATNPSLFDVARTSHGIESVIGDVRDAAAIGASLEAARPEIVLHLAAQSLVRHSYSDPVETYSVNVMGTLHLLEAVRRTSSVRAVLIVTSDKCYENREWRWGYRETEPMGGYDPYSSSKACAELLTASYRDSYFPSHAYSRHRVSIATARAGNVIGGGDWSKDRLIPDIIRALRQAVPADIRSPRAVRPWQHALEPLAGYLMLTERMFKDGPAFAEAWNFGPNDSDSCSVEAVVRSLVTLWGGRTSWAHRETAQLHEAHSLRLDSSKARQELGWHPQWPLGNVLERIVSWHKAHDCGSDMRAHCLAEIHDYFHASTKATIQAPT